jgi:hypothetical protein
MYVKDGKNVITTKLVHDERTTLAPDDHQPSQILTNSKDSKDTLSMQ